MAHLSEDDIRTKVVYEWLKGCGLSKNSIRIEHSFTIQFGRITKTVHPRTDVLVTTDGNNLLIIEVKNPSHVLNSKDVNQALSYARILKDGIAPFTIITNGRDTEFYDSVTGQSIEGDFIPVDHPYVKSSFLPTGDSLGARAEALEYFLSLSAGNLLAFCRGQVESRMQILKGNDVFSGKKYIPSLYVERDKALQELTEKLLDKEKPRRLLLIIGPPQHGKTCFMCHTTEQFIDNGFPCLFYPAIGLNRGLLQAVQEDFEWCFSEHMEPVHWVARLNGIGKKLGKQIFLFVDGWNEMVERALEINKECERLGLSNISVVLSTTSPSLQRLLNDQAGNPTYVAEKTNLKMPILNRLIKEAIKETSKLGIVQIGKFNHSENEKARKVYSQAYELSRLPLTGMFYDPFYLRIACEQYSGGVIPENVTRTELIKNSLSKKAARQNIGEIELTTKLADLAKVFYVNDRPTNITNLPACFQSDDYLQPWIECAILVLLTTERELLVDFYYTHDLNYSIAILHKKWTHFFSKGSEDSVLSELQECTKTETGKSSLRWFLSCPENCQFLERLFGLVQFQSCFNLPAGKILTESVIRQVTLNGKVSFKWLDEYIDKLLVLSTNKGVKVEQLPDLIFSLVMSLDREKEQEPYHFWMRLLVKYDTSVEDIGIQESYVHQVYGDEIRTYDGYIDYTSFDIDLFEEFIWDEDLEVVKKAALFLGYVCPNRFLEIIPSLATRYKRRSLEWLITEPCLWIIDDMRGNYFGNMCPGWLENVEKGSQEIIDEFRKQEELWNPVRRLIDPKGELNKSIYEIMAILSEYALDGIVNEPVVSDPNQLRLDL